MCTSPLGPRAMAEAMPTSSVLSSGGGSTVLVDHVPSGERWASISERSAWKLTHRPPEESTAKDEAFPCSLSSCRVHSELAVNVPWTSPGLSPLANPSPPLVHVTWTCPDGATASAGSMISGSRATVVSLQGASSHTSGAAGGAGISARAVGVGAGRSAPPHAPHVRIRARHPLPKIERTIRSSYATCSGSPRRPRSLARARRYLHAVSNSPHTHEREPPRYAGSRDDGGIG